MTLTTDIFKSAPRLQLAAARNQIVFGLRRWCERISERHQMRLLLECDDRVLKDIGVSRAEVRRLLSR